MGLYLAAIESYLARFAGAPVSIERMCELGGESADTAALKAFGYGKPLRIDYRVRRSGAALEQVVLRRVSGNGFGRERMSDRAGEVWLDYETFSRLPRHCRARDMAVLARDGSLRSVADAEELVLLTDYAPGTLYAADLKRLSGEARATPLDRERAEALASYLAAIHAVKHDDPLLWRRRLRDLVGHGEGIMGLADSYAPDYAVVPPAELRALEAAANEWRWRLKPLAHRLAQVHGDFHPFNVLFAEGRDFVVLDRSRGAWGEPADDVSAMTINYIFFSLQRSGRLEAAFAELHQAFWTRYLAERDDPQLVAVIQPWLAWRVLVLASPQWYPTIADAARRQLMRFAFNVMAEPSYAWAEVNRYLEAGQ